MMQFRNSSKGSVMEFAPVAVFAYRRPLHLRRTLDALATNTDALFTHVTVFVDGPRTESELADVERVAEEARRPRQFGQLEIVRHSANRGLATSITSGVSSMLEKHDSVIVLEDDLVTSPAFLHYMNDGLRRFAADENVISIHGYNYPIGIKSPFFLRGADCWGWATWRRGWSLYDPDGESLLDQLRTAGLTDQFDFNGGYPFTRMLAEQVAGRNDSWAVRWYASAFLADRLTLYPGQTLVQNIGNDGTGTHSGQTDRFKGVLAQTAPDLSGISVGESKVARAAFKSFFRASEPPRARCAVPIVSLGRRLAASAARRLRRKVT